MYAMAQIQMQDSIQGASLLRVQAALRTLEASGRKLRNLDVRVLNGTKPSVVFVNADGSPDIGIQEGGPPLSGAELTALVAKEKETDGLKGSSLAPLLAAAAVFQKRNLDLKHYRVNLMRQGASYVAIFKDKDAPEGGLGNLGKRPGLEVELATDDLRVIRSNFIR